MSSPDSDSLQIRLIALVRSSDRAVADQIVRRLDMEYGLFGAPHLIEPSKPGEPITFWLSFARPLCPTYMIDAEKHARRIEKLYRSGTGESLAEVSFGYVNGDQVVRAVRSPGPGRIWLSAGIWAEIIADEGIWASKSARDFYNSARL